MLGILLLLFAGFEMLGFVLSMRFYSTTWLLRIIWRISCGAAPGTLYIVLSVFLKRRALWAVITGIAVTSLIAVFTLFVFCANIAFANTNMPIEVLIPAVILGIMLLALGQLIYHLSRSFTAITLPPIGEELRGFEVIPMATPVLISQDNRTEFDGNKTR